MKRCVAGLRAALFGAAVLAFGAVTASVGATSVAAAEYEVWSCRGPDGSPISTVAWKQSEEQAVPGDVAMTDTCASGGSLDAEAVGAVSPIGRSPLARLSFDLAPGLRIKGYELSRYLKVAPGTIVSVYRAGLTEVGDLGSESSGCASVLVLPFFGCTEVGAPSDPDDPSSQFAKSGLDLTGLSLWAQCETAGCLPVLPQPGARFRLFRSKVTVDDPAAPAPPLLSGSILEPGDISGKANLMVEAEDAGSGIAGFAISIDGGPEQTLPPRDPQGICEQPYDRAQPCPALAARLFTIDTDLLSEGQHTLSGKVRDAAGNERAFGPIAFHVKRATGGGTGGGGGDDVGPGNGTPAVNFPQLKLARKRINHDPRKLAEIRGRILTASGQPVVGASLEVEMEVQRLRAPRLLRLPTVRSGLDGSFRVPVPGSGHRVVIVSFSPAPGLPATRLVRADVVSTLAIDLRRRPARLPRGGRLTLSGRLLGGGETVGGANVEIQSIVSGGWRTVANVAADNGGRFKWRYRFRYVDRDAIFSFRAVVRRTPGWPWRTLRSRRVAVRIVAG